MHEKKEKGLKKPLLLAAAVIIALIIAAAAVYFIWEEAPARAGIGKEAPQTPEPSAEATAVPTPTPTPVLDCAVAPDTERQDGVYTILLVGEDLWTGHTDTILVGKIDTNEHPARHAAEYGRRYA